MTFGFLTKQQSADLFVTITNNCTNSLPVGKHTIVSAVRSSGGNRSNPCHAPLSGTANRPLPPYPGRKNTSRTPAPQPGLRPDGASFQRKKRTVSITVRPHNICITPIIQILFLPFIRVAVVCLVLKEICFRCKGKKKSNRFKKKHTINNTYRY